MAPKLQAAQEGSRRKAGSASKQGVTPHRAMDRAVVERQAVLNRDSIQDGLLDLKRVTIGADAVVRPRAMLAPDSVLIFTCVKSTKEAVCEPEAKYPTLSPAVVVVMAAESLTVASGARTG